MTTVNSADIERAILLGAADQLNRQLDRIAPRILAVSQQAVLDMVRASPEYASLSDGGADSAYHVFGLVNGKQAGEEIAAAVSKGVLLEKNSFVAGPNMTGGLTVSILRSDMSEVLSLGVASFLSEGKFRDEVPWLRWMLTAGDSLVLSDFAYIPKSSPRNSRTELGLMVKSRKKPFFLPPELRGTLQDNWLTKALIGVEQTIISAFLRESQ